MNNLAIEIKNEGPFDLKWFSNESAVFACLSRMIKDGWVPSDLHSGVVHGTLVARPVKSIGNKTFTGVGLWIIN